MPDNRLRTGEKVTLVRPNGSELQVTPEQAEKLKLLGYQEESGVAAYERAREGAAEEYYTGTGQQIIAGAEGLARGVTLGASDYLFSDEESKARAQYNPGVATATEIAGAIAPVVLSGGSSLLASTPTALLARGAVGAAKAVGATGRVARGAVAGALEGAAAGAASTVNHAYLNDDPLTAEAVVAGIGWGTLFGAGTGAIAGKIEAKAAEKIRQATAQKVLQETTPAYNAFTREIGDFGSQITKAAAKVDSMVNQDANLISKFIKENVVDDVSKPVANELVSSIKSVIKAQKTMDPVAIEIAYQKLSQSHQKAVSLISNKASAPKLNVADPVAAFKKLGDMRVVSRELNNFPTTIEQFAKLSEAKSERLFGALDLVKKLDEFPVMAKAADDAAKALSSAFGLQEGSLSELRKVWSVAKESSKISKESAKPGIIPRALGMAAGAAVSLPIRLGGSRFASSAAYVATKDAVVRALTTGKLVAARNSVLSRLTNATKGFAKTTGWAFKPSAARIEPLAVKLDGSTDKKNKTAEELALSRIDEFARASQHVNDTLYLAVEPLSGEQPLLMPAVHRTAVQRFAKFRAMMPADPGIISGLKSIWKPSPLQSAILSKQYEVFLDPIGTTESMLKTGQLDPIKIKALKALDPAVYGHLRSILLEEFTSNKALQDMDIDSQRALGALMDLNIHSSMRPGFIASSLQLHTKRNQPTPTPTAPGATNPGGRPAVNSSLSTMSQRITEH
jgi:hypothetical protein